MPQSAHIMVHHGKLGGANKGLGEAPKSCTRKEHENATNSIAKRGQGGTSSLFVCPLQGQGTRPLWGLGQRPNCSAGDQHLKRTQQRRRQRSVPASNFARPQTRSQAALPPRFREEPNKTASSPVTLGLEAVFALSFFGQHRRTAHGLVQPQLDVLAHQAVRRHHLRRIHPSGGTRRQHRSQPVYLRR